MNIQFENKRILVTGAASGIGRGIAQRLASHGAIVLALDKSQANLDELKNEIPSIITSAIDIGDWTATQTVIKSLVPIDLLVNCAGIAETVPFTDIDETHYLRTFDVNIKGLIAVTQAVVNHLLETQSGASIVNISSIAAKAALCNHTMYGATKGAVDAFTRTLALELGPKGIRVNSINPTIVMTPLGRKAWADPNDRYAMLAKTPLQRFAEVDDVVDAVVFLLSDHANMITGHCLSVDGGFLAA